MITLVLVKNPFSPQDGREVKHIEYSGTLADLMEENKMPGVDLLATVNGFSVDATTEIHDGDFIVLYPAIEKGGKGGKGILGIIAAIALSVVAMGVGGLVATGVWGSFAGASALAATAGYLTAAAIMFLGSSLIGRTSGQKLDEGSYDNEATYSWAGVQTMEGQNNPIALTYGLVKSGGQTIGKYTMASGSDDYLYWLVAAGEGPVSIDEVKLNDNDIGMYKDVRYEVRAGNNDQEIIPFFGDTHFTLNLSYNMEDLNVWYTSAAQGTATEGLIIKIECPNGIYHVNDSGDMQQNRIGIQIQIQRTDVTTPVWLDYNDFPVDLTDWDSSLQALVLSGDSNKAVRKEYRIDRITAGEYSARVRVVYRQYSEAGRDSFSCYWTGVSSVVYDDFIYPNIALIGIKAKATGQLSGAPTLNFKKWRTVVYVWNPYNRQYEQKHAYNPAWACYDLIHQAKPIKNINTGQYEYEVRGAGVNFMRYDDFAAWAAYCEIKNYYVNIEIVVAGELLDVCNDKIAPIGHGRVVRFGTKYGCIYAHPQDPVQMFGMGNISSGTFQEEFLKVADRANCVEVTFTNSAAGYERDVLTIYSETYDTDGYAKTAQVTMDGITKYSQAYREGMYQLLCNKYQLRTVSFEAGIDSIACTVGDCVLISHDVPKWANSGRIEKVEGRMLTLPVELSDLLSSYRIQYRKQNDTLYTYAVTIVSSADGWTVCTLPNSVEVAKLPEVGDIFDLAIATVGSKPFIVQSITRAQDFTRQISCLEYDERVFTEPENYDGDDEHETVYTVTINQVNHQAITVKAHRGLVEETHTHSFTKEETGWFIDVSMDVESGYAKGSILINGISYGVKGVSDIPLNRDYLVSAQPAETGSTVYMDGTMDRFTSTIRRWYVFFSDVACTTRVSKNDLTGKITVIDVNSIGGLPYWGTGILGEDNSLNQRCTQIREADVSSIDVSHKTDFSHSIAQCWQLQTIYGLSAWDPVSATSFSNLFRDSSQLTEIGDISHWSMPDLTTVREMFRGLNQITSIDLHYWSTPSLADVHGLFDGCTNLRAVDISGINTTNVTDAVSMFYNCGALQYVIMDANEIKFSGSVIFPEPNNTVKYLVPAGMVESYKAHANWSSRAARIDSLSNYTIIRANGHVSVVEGG